jgi:hypothetical protein
MGGIMRSNWFVLLALAVLLTIVSAQQSKVGHTQMDQTMRNLPFHIFNPEAMVKPTMFPVGTVAHSRGQDIPVLKLPADIEDRTGKGLIRALVLPQPLDDLSL